MEYPTEDQKSRRIRKRTWTGKRDKDYLNVKPDGSISDDVFITPLERVSTSVGGYIVMELQRIGVDSYEARPVVASNILANTGAKATREYRYSDYDSRRMEGVLGSVRKRASAASPETIEEYIRTLIALGWEPYDWQKDKVREILNRPPT